MRCIVYAIFFSFSEQTQYVASVWMVMAHLGCDAFHDLNGPKIHHLENVMTMDLVFHGFYDSLDFYLEQTVSRYFQEQIISLTLMTVNSPPIQTSRPHSGDIRAAP